MIADGVVDMRRWFNATPYYNQLRDAVTPIVARMEPWGKQEGQEWAYTYRPGKHKFAGGTAPGGWMVMPPEIDLADRTAFAPDGVTKSAT